MDTQILSDPKINEIVTDVVVRYREHEQYGSQEKAIKAIIRRYPGLSSESASEAFGCYLALLDATIVLIENSGVRSASKGKFASPDDINFEEIVLKLKNQFPEYPTEILTSFINWVIVWHYLK
jgi:hypothetical protein